MCGASMNTAFDLDYSVILTDNINRPPVIGNGRQPHINPLLVDREKDIDIIVTGWPNRKFLCDTVDGVECFATMIKLSGDRLKVLVYPLYEHLRDSFGHTVYWDFEIEILLPET